MGGTVSMHGDIKKLIKRLLKYVIERRKLKDVGMNWKVILKLS
jgi:hypothetical protein